MFKVTLTDLTQNFDIVVTSNNSKEELVDFVLQWYLGHVINTDRNKPEMIDLPAWFETVDEMRKDLIKNDKYQCDLYGCFDVALQITFEHIPMQQGVD